MLQWQIAKVWLAWRQQKSKHLGRCPLGKLWFSAAWVRLKFASFYITLVSRAVPFSGVSPSPPMGNHSRSNVVPWKFWSLARWMSANALNSGALHDRSMLRPHFRGPPAIHRANASNSGALNDGSMPMLGNLFSGEPVEFIYPVLNCCLASFSAANPVAEMTLTSNLASTWGAGTSGSWPCARCSH